MKIVLISPKGPLYRHRGGIFGKTLRYAPLTLTTLAALIPSDLDCSVSLADEGIAEIDLELEADLVAMTVITGNARRAYELSAHFRNRGIAVVLGGPHVTLAPEDAAPHADAIAVGYAEETWPQLLRDFSAGRLHPRYDQDPDFKLGGFPRPRRDLLPKKHYLTTAVFEASRGCAHSCEFCVAPSAWGQKQLQKPIEEIIDDIRTHGSKRIIFVDLNLISDPAYAASLFEALIPLRVEWFGLTTTLIAENLELLDLASRSGCRGLLMGLESINPQALKECRKGFNSPESYPELVERLHRRRIALQACFVFGLDQDTPDVFDKTARLCMDAKIDLPRFAAAVPFPGTPLFKRLEKEGRILTRNWDFYDGQHVVFQPARMTVQELQEGVQRAWLKTYSLASIARRLSAAASPFYIACLANLGYRFYARRLNRFYTCDWPMAAGLPARAAAA